MSATTSSTKSRRRSTRPVAPPTPPFSEDEHHTSVQDFFEPHSQLPTPPPSLPTSPPDSPSLRRKSRSIKRSSLRLSVSSLTAFQSSEKEKETVLKVEIPGADSENHYPSRYPIEPTSPILPKVKLAFPTILSDEEDSWTPSQPQPLSFETPPQSQSSSPAEHHRRTWSQTSTQTTTETQTKTKRRSWRYSLPANMDQFKFGDSSTDDSSATTDKSKKANKPRRTNSLRDSASTSTSHARRHSFQPLRSSSASRTGSGGSRPSTPTLPRTTSRRSFLPFLAASSHTPAPPPPPPALISHLPSLNVKPLMSAFFFLTLTLFACASISIVLLAGFSLTFYDDVNRRLGVAMRGIENGQRRLMIGMGQMWGGAKEALEVVVGSSKRIHFATNNTTSTSSSSVEPQSTAHDSDSSSTSSSYRGRSRPRRRSSKSTATSAHNLPPHNNDEWISDSDAQPYDVPNSTPYHSRNSSPRRLPPRPPLAYLIPSIVLALVWTMWKIVRSWWWGNTKRERESRRAQ